MKPAWSVIFFTVSSGAGLGLCVWLALAALVQVPFEPAGFLRAMIIAGLLCTAGLVSSAFHLANPRNAWQSFRRVGSSWLSREAVLAVLLYPVALWFAVAVFTGGRRPQFAAFVLGTVATAVLLSTAMIYACLRTVPQWHNWQTRFGMPLYGLMSGGLVLLGTWPLRITARPVLLIVLVLLVLGLIVKYSYFMAFPRLSASAPSMNEALNLGIDPRTQKVNARVRLLDVGHGHGTFLTREFGYTVPRGRLLRLRLAALAASFVLPFALLLWLPRWPWLATVVCLVGLMLERWLFFAEARHVVRRYHGLPMD